MIRKTAAGADLDPIVLTRIYTGVQFTSTVQNDARRVDSSVAIGDDLWISWAPGNTLVLTE